MKKKIAIVTGGAGFIGSHMVELLLNEGFNVRVIDNLVGGRIENLKLTDSTKIDFENVNILNLKEDSKIFSDASYVFHFAGIGDIVPSIENPIDYISSNVLGTAKVLQCCVYSKINKFLYAASSSCYGLASTPTNENHPINPLYPYAISKYQGEQLSFHWKNVYGLNVNSIRIFNAYGTRSRTSGAYGAVFGVFLKQKLAGVPLTVVGTGEQARDFLYVSDVVKAFYCLANSNTHGQIYNLGAGKPQSVNKLVKLLDSKVEFIPERPGEPKITWADITKIKKELSWAPKVSFEEGVKLILKNIDYWKDAPLWDKNSIENETKSWFKLLSK